MSEFSEMDKVAKRLKKADSIFENHSKELMELNEKVIKRKDRVSTPISKKCPCKDKFYSQTTNVKCLACHYSCAKCVAGYFLVFTS